MDIKLINDDCLKALKEIPDNSIDMILTDPPYGTTQNKWDSVIPLNEMWLQLNRIIKDNGAIVLTAAQPFTSILISSNLKMFKYNWIYQKNKASGYLNAKKQPLNNYEDICVFYKKQCKYNPQMTKAKKIYKRGFVDKQDENYGKQKPFNQKETGLRYPKRIQYFNNNTKEKGFHPTQKPTSLLEYLIKTYTDEGEMVLDFTMGSGSTGVACKNLNRNFIGIEIDKDYFDIAEKRIKGN